MFGGTTPRTRCILSSLYLDFHTWNSLHTCTVQVHTGNRGVHRQWGFLIPVKRE